MDNQQLPKHQQAELSTPKLLGLSALQKEILAGIQADYVRQILSMQFNEPENDVLLLRQHANVHGAMQAVEAILTYDAVTLHDFEDRIRNQTN